MNPTTRRREELLAADIMIAHQLARASRAAAEKLDREKVAAQVERAASIARKKSISTLTNGTQITHQTGWVNIEKETETGHLVQAQLYSIGTMKYRIPIGLDLSIPLKQSTDCVQLYLRLSNPETQVHSNYDYPVLFTPERGGDPASVWLSPTGTDVNKVGEPVTMDTADWTEIDAILSIFESPNLEIH